MELSIVMPCLNEAETLAVCIDKAQRYLKSSGLHGEVVIGDNGSTDGSQAIAREHGARVIDVPLRGYGAALYAACEGSRGKYIIMGDSDDSYDFSSLDAFVARLRAGDDLVMGNRFAGGIKPGAMPWKNRYIGNPLLSGIGKILFSTPIRDFHCGLRAFSKTAFERMDLKTLGMEFASEMVIKATLLNMRVTEVPTSLWPDGRSRPPHLRPWRDGWRHLRFMLLFSPNWLFLYPGLLTMILGITLVIILSRGSLSIGGVNFDVNTLIYSAFASIIGFQAVLFSILSRIYAVQNRLYPNTGGFLKFSDWFSLESGVILGFFIALAGFVGAIFSFQEWNHQNFGNLDLGVTSRHVIPSAMAMSLGSETILFSLFQSCLSLSLLHSSPAKNGFRGD
jgi:glycosyltransferase involved in cell wall biosynthesis